MCKLSVRRGTFRTIKWYFKTEIQSILYVGMRENYHENIIQYNSVTKKTALIYSGNSAQNGLANSNIMQIMVYNRDLYLVDKTYKINTYNYKSTLIKVDLDSLAITDLYQGTLIQGYTIYGGDIYVLNMKGDFSQSSDSDDVNLNYEIIKLNGSKTDKMTSGNGFTRALSAINNCLYYYNDSQIMELDLATKKITAIVQDASCVAFYGNMVCYADDSGNIYKAMLSNIPAKKLVYSGDVTKTGDLISINYYQGSLYFNFDWMPRIEKVSAAGQWEAAPTKTNHLIFGIFDGNYIYTDYDGNTYVAPLGSALSQHVSLTKFLSVGESGSPSITLPGIDAGSTVKLSAEQIYAQCSPAVFRIETYDSDSKMIGTASGFIISSDGVAVTNYHVFQGAAVFKVILSDGSEYWPESIAGASASKDIVIFKIPGSGFHFLKIGDPGTLAGGQNIYTIGSPFGLESTISTGLISNPRRNLGGGDLWIQISAPISPGSSGGALINEYGQVIGITTASISLDDAQNLNLAIPIDQIYGVYLQ